MEHILETKLEEMEVQAEEQLEHQEQELLVVELLDKDLMVVKRLMIMKVAQAVVVEAQKKDGIALELRFQEMEVMEQILVLQGLQ